ncbi:MAG: hypothetical protein U1E17_04705 [Geminicoccaceae bacterium]
MAEERAFQRCAGLARPGAVHYRRPDPVGHKTGNLWEWLERAGTAGSTSWSCSTPTA